MEQGECKHRGGLWRDLCAEGGWGQIGQIATCNLNLKATRFSGKKADQIKVERRKEDGEIDAAEGEGA